MSPGEQNLPFICIVTFYKDNFNKSFNFEYIFTHVSVHKSVSVDIRFLVDRSVEIFAAVEGKLYFNVHLVKFSKSQLLAGLKSIKVSLSPAAA